jgi:hypothetical protein
MQNGGPAWFRLFFSADNATIIDNGNLAEKD